MSAKKEEFKATGRYEKLYSLLAAVDRVEQLRRQKEVLFDKIVEILSVASPNETAKMTEIRTIIATYSENEHGR